MVFKNFGGLVRHSTGWCHGLRPAHKARACPNLRQQRDRD